MPLSIKAAIIVVIAIKEGQGLAAFKKKAAQSVGGNRD
jgi:hypothetical protein